jgi:hypothetical protein
MAEPRRSAICGAIILLVLAGLAATLSSRSTDPLAIKRAGASIIGMPTPAEQTALLERHKPILYLQRDETWPPVRADQFVLDAQLEKQFKNDRWKPIWRPNLPTSKEGCSFTPCFRLNLPCDLKNRGARCFDRGAPPSDWNRAAVYGSFAEIRHPLRLDLDEPAAYLLRYSYFYYFDDWRTPRGWLWQVHEADWEAVTIGLSATRKPLFAAYSQHCSGVWHKWTEKELLKPGGHPVVFVSLGSHANYFRPVNKPVYLFRCRYSQDSWGKVARLVKAYGKGRRLFDRVDDSRGTPTATTLVDLTVKRPGWADFLGVWSEGEYVYTAPLPTPVNRARYGEGPKTPALFSDKQKDFWHESSN